MKCFYKKKFTQPSYSNLIPDHTTMIAKLSVRCAVHWPCLHYRLCQCPLCLSFQNFGRNFRLKPKFVIGFRFRPSRNRNLKIGVRFRPHRNRISAIGRISAEIFGFVCSLEQVYTLQTCIYWDILLSLYLYYKYESKLLYKLCREITRHG